MAYALASNWVFHHPPVQRPIRAARALLKRKQTEILAWLGFPATDATRKVLRKIVPKSISVPTLLYLRDAIKNPETCKALAHIGRLNAGAMRIVTDDELRF